MKKFQTPKKKRATYRYENGVEIRPGENGVTDVLIAELHQQDDDEWNQYHADSRNDLKCHTAANVSIEDIDADGVWLGNDGGNPEDIYIRKETRREVRAAVAKLKPKQAEAVTAVWLDGMKVSEYAAFAGIKENTASDRINRGLAALRKLLSE